MRSSGNYAWSAASASRTRSSRTSKPNGLASTFSPSRLNATTGQSLGRVTGHHQDAQRGAGGGQKPREARSVGHGHDDVGQEKVDRLPRLESNPHGVDAISGR